MNNQTKILVSIQGIEGGTLRLAGTKKVKYSLSKKDLYPEYSGKDAQKIVKRGTFELKEYDKVPVHQSIKMTKDAYDYFTGKERPSWVPKKYDWGQMTKKQRLEMHLQRTCEYLGGKSFTYSILED